MHKNVKWLSYLGVLGLLGFVNPYFSSLGALSVFQFATSEDPKLRRVALLGFIAFIGPIIILSKTMR